MNRGTGRTTRMLWKALIYASEEANRTSYVVCASHAVMRWMRAHTWALLTPIRGVKSEHGDFVLPNGSKLIFMTAQRFEENLHSRRIESAFYDHHMPQRPWRP
jgi:hypothetical protein